MIEPRAINIPTVETVKITGWLSKNHGGANYSDYVLWADEPTYDASQDEYSGEKRITSWRHDEFEEFYRCSVDSPSCEEFTIQVAKDKL